MVLIIDLYECDSKKSKKSNNTEIVGSGYDEVKLTKEERIKKKNSTILPEKALDSLKSDAKAPPLDNDANKKLLKFLNFKLK